MLYLGDCQEILKTLPENSVDACVCDPPYGLSFMGKRWDYDVPSVDIWREVYRVLKPGGHVLSFGGTRTYHRMVVNIEDAGFEIRDQVQWIYGSGFPKSHNVSKAIDKMAGAEREIIEYKKEPYTNVAQNKSNSQGKSWHAKTDENGYILTPITAPATPEAKQWDGWGSALKPANEPVCLARKPLEKGLTLADNVLKYGTGAINVDGCRIEAGPEITEISSKGGNKNKSNAMNDLGEVIYKGNPQGRWPANVLFDEDAAEMLDAQSGPCKTGNIKAGTLQGFGKGANTYGEGSVPREYKTDEATGASRFFYVAKASKSERSKGLDCSFLVWENDAWEKQDLKSTLTAMLELAKDTSADILADDSSWSTDIYGHSISEQYPKGMIFTISTVLKTITELKILSASPSLNTRESIQDAIKTIEASGLNLAESVSFINQLELNTTSEKTAYLLGVVRAALPMLLQIKGFAKTNNFHSTVKPIKLMEYLITLITPPSGTVLDPFMGSGSTGVAAKNLGFNFIGCEMSPEYHAIAQKRIEHANQNKQEELL